MERLGNLQPSEQGDGYFCPHKRAAMHQHTTSVNPGAFQVRRKRSFRKYLGEIYGRLRKAQWRAAFHYAVAEGLNMLYERRILSGRQSRFRCPICHYEGSYFVSLGNALRIAWHSACPQCNSRSRHRGLKFLYEEILEGRPGADVLYFAPEPILLQSVQAFNRVRVVTTDYLLEDVDYPGEDIQALSFQEGAFDVVLCNHVIEHVPDDRKALAEIHRVLRPGGMAVITVPGDWHRPHTIRFENPADHNGHYRDYGADFTTLLRSIFPKVEVKNLADYEPPAPPRYGIRPLERAFLAYRSPNG